MRGNLGNLGNVGNLTSNPQQNRLFPGGFKIAALATLAILPAAAPLRPIGIAPQIARSPQALSAQQQHRSLTPASRFRRRHWFWSRLLTDLRIVTR